jgi:hypothetical protein
MNDPSRVVVIAPQKSGTHLIQELFIELGYASVGSIKQNERNTPHFDRATRLSIAKVVYDDATFARCELADEDEFERLTDRAWHGMLYGWYQRFGQPVLSRYGASKHQDPSAIISAKDFYSAPFAATPPRLVWYWHQLIPGEFDGQFTNEWYAGDGPPVLLNVRDPRDCLVSIINFMEGKTAHGFGNFAERQIFNRILSTCDTWDEKLESALTDPHFPGATEFEDIIWLWRHPDVATVRYEDLVGPRGGGTADRQIGAVKGVLEQVRSDADPVCLAQRIYSENSWSFLSGRQGGWLEVFSPRMRAAFAERYGNVLEIFGYEP